MKAERHIRSIDDLQPGDHVCCFIESDEERRAVIQRFVGDGLEVGEKVLYIHHGRGPDEVLEMLEVTGIECRSRLEDGSLVLATGTDTYLEGGFFDRERMLDRLRGEVDRALAEGYSALRVTGEMGWTREAALEPGALMLYEVEADALVAASSCTVLCQYTASECGTTELVALLAAHPLIAVGEDVFENPYHSSVSDSHADDSGPVSLRRVIQGLKERGHDGGSIERERARALEYFEAAGTMLVALDTLGTISSINRKGLEILGYESAEELIGRSWFDTCIPAESREEVRGVFERIMLGEIVTLRRYDNPVVTGDGEERLISWFNVVLTGPDGRPTGTLSSGDDVTEERWSQKILGIQRRLAVRALEASSLEETARYILDAVLDAAGFECGGVYVADGEAGAMRLIHHEGLSGEFVSEVGAYEPGSPNWWLISEGEPVYFNYLEGQLPLDDVKRREGIKAIAIIPLVHSGTVSGCVNAASRKAEEVGWHSREAIESVISHVGLVMSRALLDAGLRSSEAKYRELVETANSIILKLDAAGAITYMNEFARAFFGYAEDEVLGRSVIGTIVPETDSAGADLAAMVRDVFENPDAYMNNENENIKKSGERVRVAWTNRPILDESGRLAGMLAVGNDVTARRRAEEEREQARRELAAVEERWDRALERLDECMFIIDTDFTILQCNAACGRLFGADHAGLVGGKCYEHVHGTDAPPEHCVTVRSVRERAEVTGELFEPHLEKYLEISAQHLSFENGSPDLTMHVIRDVTAKKQLEEELRMSEERFRAMSEAASDAIIVLDPEGLVDYWNPAAERTFGYSEEEALGVAAFELLSPESDRSEHARRFAGFGRTGTVSAGSRPEEFTAVGRDGREIPVEVTTSALMLEGRWHALVVIRDITERKRAEADIEHSRRLLEDTGRMAKVGGWEFEVDTMQQTWTDETYRIHDLDPSARPDVEQGISFFPPEVEPVIRSAVERAVEYGEPYDLELPLVTAKGRRLWVRTIGRVEREGGATTRVHGTIQDVTELKLLEEDLRRTEERYRLLYEYAGEAIFTYDRDLTVTGVNRVACEILGYDREELVGRRIQEAGVLHPDDWGKAFDDISRLMAGEPVVRDRLRFVHKDGSVLLAEVTGAGLYRGDELVGITNIALDITERVAADEAVRKNAQQLKDLVDVAAHEIRHPAAVLKGYAATLLAYGGSIDSEMSKDALAAIYRASDRLGEMVGQLMDTSKLERGTFELALRGVEPEALVLEAVMEMRAKGTESEFTLLPASAGGPFTADGEKVRQALLILLDNASRYSPAGSEVELWYERRPSEVVFSVADRGPGLSEADRRNVFERFYQVEDAAHHSGPGLGLGLYIASRIAEAHGGWIKADPRPGGGSVFSFGLPARPPGHEPPGASL